MIFIYNLLIHIVGFLLKFAAPFNEKLRLFVNGRKDVFASLASKIDASDKIIWFHTASLGEFEQGLPLMEQIKKQYPDYKLLLSFFSPSGFEVKKNDPVADLIVYLPLDTAKNAKKFLALAQPKIAVFVKYEFWPNYLNQLNKQKVPTFLVSAIFRPEQVFFKSYGSLMRSSLKTFDYFFVQDQNSKTLLGNIGLNNVQVSGDTRFDRVSEILERSNALAFIETFKANQLCVVAGSTWKEDESLLVPFINMYSGEGVKFIIAPHNIKASQIQQLKKQIDKKTLLFSEMEGENPENYQVFILDTIGILTKVYSYADIAYVGGGMGNLGLHNTLEPAVFATPVIIGKNYTNFREAIALVELKGSFSIDNQERFNHIMSKLLADTSFRQTAGAIAGNYVKDNTGASKLIINHLSKFL